MKRRTFLISSAAALSVWSLLGCGSDKPRSLILADGTGTVHNRAVDARAKVFEKKTGRSVRILLVDGPQAVLLASRGEADVAIVPFDMSIDSFIAGEHGRVAGQLANGGERLKVLEVDAKFHPKVDAKGAKDLAAALITPP
ncbi:MAG: hypothetical protein IPK82_11920 [Polyangiaceae bacterium]|nr:hypothetical protein [Polyangiaceae bacterium]